MNENIGAKGGKNDRKRTLIITMNQKKKLEDIEKRQKENRRKKSIKRIDFETFIKIIPLLIAFNTLEVVTPRKKKEDEKRQDEEKSIKEKEDIEQKNVDLLENIETLKREKAVEDKQKQTELLDSEQRKSNASFHTMESVEKSTITEVQEQPFLQDKKPFIESISSQTIPPVCSVEEEKKEETLKSQELDNVDSLLDSQTEYNSLNTEIRDKGEKADVSIAKKINKEQNTYTLKKVAPILLSTSLLITGAFVLNKEKEKKNPSKKLIEDNLNRLTNVKLIETYENELKNIRYDLKKLIYEYNLLVDEEESTYTSEGIKELIQKLNAVILRIEELKRKLDLDNISRYDDEYVRNTVNEYMDILGKGIVIDELKDSELYILLSNKIEELETKKDHFEEHVLEKEDTISYDEKEINLAKQKYESLGKFNIELDTIQTEQEKLLQYLQEKVANSEKVEERVETTVTILNNQSRRLLQLLAASMLIPTVPGAQQVAFATLTYLYFLRRALMPDIRRNYRRYRKITIEDYSDNILDSLRELNNVSDLLYKCSLSLDEMIENFKTEYKDYIDYVPECAELLENLKQMQNNLKEKEFELDRIKKEQQKNLELNNDKVKILYKEELIDEQNDTI